MRSCKFCLTDFKHFIHQDCTLQNLGFSSWKDPGQKNLSFHNKSLPKNCTPEVLPFRKVTEAGNQPVSKKLILNRHNESGTGIVLKPCCLSFSPQVIGLMPGKNGQPPYVTCGAKVIPLCLSHITVWIRACWASAVCTHLTPPSCLRLNHICLACLFIIYTTCCLSPLFTPAVIH